MHGHMYFFQYLFFAFKKFEEKRKIRRKEIFCFRHFLIHSYVLIEIKKMKSECWRNNIFLFGKRAIIIGSFIYFYTSIIQFSCMDSDRSLFSFLVICSYWISFIHKNIKLMCLKKFLSFRFVCNVEISFIKKLPSLSRSMTSLQSLPTSRWQISHNDLMTFVNANREKSKNK